MKKRTTFYIEENVILSCKNMQINMSAVSEGALMEQIEAMRKWRGKSD